MGTEETDFNAEDYPAEYVVVEVSDSMSSIFERIEEAWTRTPNAVLIIPRDTQVFHNTQDFLALGKRQGARDVRASIASLDPTILGLARLLGFHTLEPPPDHPALANDPALGSTTLDGDVEQPTAPLTIGGATETNLTGWVVTSTVPTYPPASTTTSPWLNYPSDPAPHAEGAHQARTEPYNVPAQYAGLSPPLTPPDQTGQLGSGLIGRTSEPSRAPVPGRTPAPRPAVSPTPTGRVKARRVVPAYQNGRRFRYGGRISSAGLSRLLIALAAVIVVVLVAGSAYAYVYLPEGSVSVTPLNESLNGIRIEVPVITGASPGSGGKTGEGAGVQAQTTDAQTAPSLNAETVSATLREEGTRPAGGNRQVPRGKGQGFMRFTNRTSNPVGVPAGAQFKASNGVTVQTTQAGTVPPTVFGQSFGTLDLPIAATVDGPDGNIAAGQVAGVYGGTLNYTNLGALQGGALETVKVVTQADIDALAADLRARIDARKNAAMHDVTPPGRQLITQTIELADTQFKADHKANQDGDNVSVSLTATVKAKAYDETKFREAINQAVGDWVQTSIPQAAGPNPDPGSIECSSPALKAVEPGRVVYTCVANGRVTFKLTTELARQVSELVSGKSISDARKLIIQNYGTYISPDSIEARVLWFTLDRLPTNPDRITVQSSADQPSYTPGGVSPVSPPQLTPDPRGP